VQLVRSIHLQTQLYKAIQDSATDKVESFGVPSLVGTIKLCSQNELWVQLVYVDLIGCFFDVRVCEFLQLERGLNNRAASSVTTLSLNQ
jgi:hypothetical protein